jgi:hypothetical protein
MAHGVLCERRDGERGVHADVGRYGRPVADQQVLVAEHALAGVDDAAGR